MPQLPQSPSGEKLVGDEPQEMSSLQDRATITAPVDGSPVLKIPLGLSAFLGLMLLSSLGPAMPLVYAQSGPPEVHRGEGHAHGKTHEEVIENHSIKILNVKPMAQNLVCNPNKQVAIIYKAKTDFSPQTIIVDMFDAEGNQIPGTRAETEGLYAGEVKQTLFCVPPQAASYKVRLPKPEE